VKCKANIHHCRDNFLRDTVSKVFSTWTKYRKSRCLCALAVLVRDCILQFLCILKLACQPLYLCSQLLGPPSLVRSLEYEIRESVGSVLFCRGTGQKNRVQYSDNLPIFTRVINLCNDDATVFSPSLSSSAEIFWFCHFTVFQWFENFLQLVKAGVGSLLPHSVCHYLHVWNIGLRSIFQRSNISNTSNSRVLPSWHFDVLCC